MIGSRELTVRYSKKSIANRTEKERLMHVAHHANPNDTKVIGSRPASNVIGRLGAGVKSAILILRSQPGTSNISEAYLP